MSQINDKTNKNANLIIKGEVYSFPFFQTPAEGSNWTIAENSRLFEYDNELIIPDSVYPNNNSGYFSFYLNTVGQDGDDNYGLNTDNGTDDIINISSNNDERWFEFWQNGFFSEDGLGYGIDYSDKNGNQNIFNVQYPFLPNVTYFIVISWNTNGFKIYINDEKTSETSVAPDFGILPSEDFTICNLEGYLDDFIISDTEYRTSGTPMIPEILGEKYLGGDVAIDGGVERGYIGPKITYVDDAGKSYEVYPKGVRNQSTGIIGNQPDSENPQVKKIPNVANRFTR